MKVCVLGAGVIGLSTALHIKQQRPDIELTIFSDVTTPHTTGDGAAGLWRPHMVTDRDTDRRYDVSSIQFNSCNISMFVENGCGTLGSL